MIPPIKNFPLGIRLSVMFAFLLFNYICFPLVASMIMSQLYGMDRVVAIMGGSITGDEERFIFLFVQGVGSLGAFAFTALLVSQMETGFVLKRLGLTIKPALKFVAIAIFAVLVAQVFIQFLSEVNQQIPLPKALKFLEEQESQAEKLTDNVLAGHSLLMFFANSLVLAIIPAVGEEFFFRGLLLGDLLKSKVSPAMAIVSTGLLFSISHFEFGNLLAIWALGCFLGYLYYSSGSLWLPMVAHFTNNFLVILFKYLYNSGYLKSDIAEATYPMYAVIISLVVFGFCLYVINNWRRPVDFSTQLSGPEMTDDEDEYEPENGEQDYR